MLFALDICVNKKAPPTHSLNTPLPPPPPSPQKHHPFFLAKPPLKSANYPSPTFYAIHLPPPPPNFFSSTGGVFGFLSELP